MDLFLEVLHNGGGGGGDDVLLLGCHYFVASNFRFFLLLLRERRGRMLITCSRSVSRISEICYSVIIYTYAQ